MTVLAWQGSGWLCGAMLASWPKDCGFDPGSQQHFGTRGSALSLTLAEVYSVSLPRSGGGLFKPPIFTERM